MSPEIHQNTFSIRRSQWHITTDTTRQGYLLSSACCHFVKTGKGGQERKKEGSGEEDAVLYDTPEETAPVQHNNTYMNQQLSVMYSRCYCH
ncbi:hypothetical protein LOAG_08161 [Loa loa]|uniref:Uncharacterized protein n=1 Tax=Loa loa TaxID=7209 RepID=A0A1I7V7C0_LOALO|nr:hypothetical protein LOAG_08161 [Loa loa]EFO20329.2 hypothetical protein LOAG_08161 [Loa loa]